MSYYHSMNYPDEIDDAYVDSYQPRVPRRNAVDPYADPYEAEIPAATGYEWNSYGHRNPTDVGPDAYRQGAYVGPDQSRLEPLGSGKQRQQTHSHIQPAVVPEPTSFYLDLAAQASSHVADPTQLRKLLILDLNGTLLFREPRVPPPRRFIGSWRDRRRDRESDPYANPPLSRPLRPVHPRPYMQSFKEYLFHPETRKWLDTMVWSSAQPHSVKDMVGRCFGEDEVVGYGPSNEEGGEVNQPQTGEENNLVAIWARDTLGLDQDAYYKKTQTTKDLSKPWSLLTSLHSGSQALGTTTSSTSYADDVPNSDPTDGHSLYNATTSTESTATPDALIPLDEDDIPGFPLRRNIDVSTTLESSPTCHLHPSNTPDAALHSAQTTLLLDDSPLKARMQPYNHVCVPEYGAVMRMRDVRIANASKLTGEDAASATPGDTLVPKVDLNATSRLPMHIQDPSLEQEHTDNSLANSKKRKRLSDSPGLPSPSSSTDTLRRKHYDHILLAVIGLLNTLKYESSVAGWVKAGGLFNALRGSEPEELEGAFSHGDTDPDLDGLYLASVPEGVERHGAINANGPENEHGNKKERWRKTKRRRIYANGTDPASASEGEVGVDSESIEDAGPILRETEMARAGNDIGTTLSSSAEDSIPGLGLAQNANFAAPAVLVAPMNPDEIQIDMDADGIVGNDAEIILVPSIVESDPDALPLTQPDDADDELEITDSAADLTLASTQPDTDIDNSLAVSEISVNLPSSPIPPLRSHSIESAHTHSQSQTSPSHSHSLSRLNASHSLSRNPSLTSLQPTEPSSSAEKFERMKRDRARHLMPRGRPKPPIPLWGEQEVKHVNSSYLYKKAGSEEKQMGQETQEGDVEEAQQRSAGQSTSDRPLVRDSIPSAFLDDSIFGPRSATAPPSADPTLPPSSGPALPTSTTDPAPNSLSSARSEPLVKDFAYDEPYASKSSPSRPSLKAKEQNQDFPPLWYQHPPARWYWVRRGIEALEELGLAVVPGVDVD